MATITEKCIELEGIGGPHALDTRNYVSVAVFVHLGDGTVIQVGFFMGKDNAPVCPPWRQRRLKTLSCERIL